MFCYRRALLFRRYGEVLPLSYVAFGLLHILCLPVNLSLGVPGNGSSAIISLPGETVIDCPYQLVCGSCRVWRPCNM